MFSITSIIFAVGFISFTSGLVKERRSAFEAALKCTKAGWDANVAALESGSGGSGGGLVEMVEDACIFFREFARCIVGVDPVEYSSSVDNIAHFLVAYVWHNNYLAEKGLCKDMMVEELKEIAVKSGIMEKDYLKNVENDPNSQCAIDSMRECMIRGELLMMQGISMDFFEGITDYIDCFEEKGATCETPILKHFVTVMKAYRKHLAETQVEYGEMVDKINPFKK